VDLNPASHALRAGLRLHRGSLLLIGLRVLALLLLGAPVLLASHARIAETVGRMPHAVEHAGPLPLSLVGVLWRQAVDAALPALLLAVPCWLLIDWLLTAAASELVARASSGEPPRVRQRLLDSRRHLGVYLRLALVGLLGLGLGLWAARALHQWALGSWIGPDGLASDATFSFSNRSLCKMSRP
jgi:hypothetical protein